MTDETVPSAVRRHRRPIVVAALVVLAVVLGLLLALASRGRFDGRYALPVAGHEPVATVSRDTLPPPVGKAAPRVMIPPAASVVAPRPDAPGATTPDDDDRQRIADAVGRATVKALRRGETVRWHKAGQSGYIVVSDAREDGARTCRNVSATVIAGAGQAQSGAHLWCRDDDDDADWAPVR